MRDIPAPPLPRLASIDRSQLLLHTLDVERLIDEDHSARSIWHLVGRMNLSLYHAKIARPWKASLAATTQHRSCSSAYGYTPTAKGLARHVKLHASVPMNLDWHGCADCSQSVIELYRGSGLITRRR